MKSKRKIDTKAIKQFFIDHTEKIVIGAVGLMFLYFAYSAVMLQVNDSYKKVPKDLEDAITTAKNTIQIGPRNKTPVAETPIPPYAEEIDTFKRPLNPNEYPFDKSIIIAPVGTRHPRGTPVIVAVQKLRAVAGRGALVSKESGTVGQRWIVVTGLFPYEDQLAEYKKMFQDANLHNDQHDVPEYIGFLVQRGEVVPGAAEPVWEKWVIFSNSKTLDNRLQNFNGEGQEVVAAANTQPALTSPLPPLAINEWDDGVACPPEINILSLQERNQNPAQGGVAAGMFQPNGQGRVRDRQIPPRGRGPAPGPAGQQQSGVDPGGDVLVGGGPAAEPVKPDANANTAQETPKYYLLRYFDFDVAPGKQYAYRAFPILRNPNYNVDAKELADLNQSQQQFLGLDTKHIQTDANGKVDGWQFSEKDWSLASRPARVSGDMRLLAGPVVEPAKPTLPTEVTGDVPHSTLGRKDGRQHARCPCRTISRHVAGFPEPDYDQGRWRPYERPRFYWLHIGRRDWRRSAFGQGQNLQPGHDPRAGRRRQPGDSRRNGRNQGVGRRDEGAGSAHYQSQRRENPARRIRAWSLAESRWPVGSRSRPGQRQFVAKQHTMTV